MRLISLFTGIGGLDLGFEKAGFKVIWANDNDKAMWETFELNFPHISLDKRSITKVSSSEIPDAIGAIGGPPCQSWSEAGAHRGINDDRGRLFFEYVRVLNEKQPLFFLAENVSGILRPAHTKAFENILKDFEQAGYNISYKLLNTNDYGVPQNRKRVIVVGYLKSLDKTFEFPEPNNYKPTLKDAIGDLDEAIPKSRANKVNKTKESLSIPNHEYMTGSFSTIYMSRNRVRSWDEPSFTIQAGARHAPIHPQAPKMQSVTKNKKAFVPGKEHLYRRLSVRECARIQTFPDEFIFKYKNISDGYKMIGNAVPVEFARQIAKKIGEDLNSIDITKI